LDDERSDGAVVHRRVRVEPGELEGDVPELRLLTAFRVWDEAFTKMRAIAVAVVMAAALVGCTGGSSTMMECDRYLACVVKLGGSTASLESTYGVNGTCWEDPAEAEKCSVRCKMAVAAFPTDAGC